MVEPTTGATAAVTDSATELPRWDVTSLFPSAGSREVAVAHEEVTADLSRLVATYDRHNIRGGPPRVAGPDDAQAAEEVLEATNDLLRRVRVLGAYLHAVTSTDATDDVASGLQSRVQADLADLTRLTRRFEAWTARVGAEALVAGSEVAAAHAYPLARAEAAAAHQMSEAEEGLFADLRLTGSVAWARLHADVTARLTAQVVRADGTVDRLPMSAVRGLATDPDPAVRRAAYEGELAAWEGAAVPLAAALNGAKGEQAVLNRRRGWADPLDPALFANSVDRSALDAMMGAVVDSLGDFRRYLRTKARRLGHQGGLPWWELAAPVAASEVAARIDWPSAVTRVRDSFAGYSPRLGALVDRATSERWIDAGPRHGKVGGAYCLPIRDGESRVLLNFDGSFDGVQTLAHELGHAYHNTNLGERAPLQRQTPMALAETASIFCETVVVAAGLDAADGEERMAILDTDLAGATQVVVDIHSRFLFEQEMCRRRASRTLGVPELCELMLDAQEQAYGDGLDADHRHPWMWAVKSHYFTPFYNWPYTFGLLFGIGLHARYLDDPDRFRAGYDDLLSSTGLADAATLATRFGIDVRSGAFWTSSLDVLRARIDDFERLTA